MTAQNTQRLAQVAVTVQFLALVRILLEFVRLSAIDGTTFSLAVGERYVEAGLLAAILTWAGVTSYLFNRYTWSALIGAATVLTLIAYKFLFMA